jgi:hypothetical protein
MLSSYYNFLVRGFADRTQSYRPYGTDRFKNVFQAINCLATII